MHYVAYVLYLSSGFHNSQFLTILKYLCNVWEKILILQNNIKDYREQIFSWQNFEGKEFNFFKIILRITENKYLVGKILEKNNWIFCLKNFYLGLNLILSVLKWKNELFSSPFLYWTPC